MSYIYEVSSFFTKNEEEKAKVVSNRFDSYFDSAKCYKEEKKRIDNLNATNTPHLWFLMHCILIIEDVKGAERTIVKTVKREGNI